MMVMSIDQPDKHHPVYRMVQEKHTNSKFAYSGKTYILNPQRIKKHTSSQSKATQNFSQCYKDI